MYINAIIVKKFEVLIKNIYCFLFIKCANIKLAKDVTSANTEVKTPKEKPVLNTFII